LIKLLEPSLPQGKWPGHRIGEGKSRGFPFSFFGPASEEDGLGKSRAASRYFLASGFKLPTLPYDNLDELTIKPLVYP